MRARLTTTAAGLATVALIGAACGGSGDSGPALTTSEDAFNAIADSLDGPLRWAMTVDAAVDLEELGALAAEYDLDDPSADQDFTQMADVADQLAGHAMTMAIGDNRTWAFALEWDGTPWVQFAVDAEAAPSADDYAGTDGTYDMSQIAPFDLGFYARVDLPTAFRVVDLFQPDTAEGADQAIADARQVALDQVGMFPNVVPLVEAFFASGWIGIDGQIDPGAWWDLVGSFDPGMAIAPSRQPSAAVIMDLLEASVTLRDLADSDGRTVATVDVHPQRALDAYVIFLQEYDTTGALRDMSGDVPDDLPDTISDVATIAFQDGRLVEVRIHGLAFAALAAASSTDRDSEDARMAAALADVQNSRFDIVMAFSDHDNVGDVASVDATTISWGEVLELMSMAAAGFAA